MTITRKEFCAGMAGGSVVLLLQACGGGGSSYGGTPAPAACGATAIAGNHGHTLTIARADLDSLVDMSYNIAGMADHPHSVTFTPAQLQQLKAGTAVVVTSTSGSSPVGMVVHTHVVTSSCP